VKDFCVGGCGIVSTGILLKDDLVIERNNGDNFCVIKTPFTVNSDLFYQELSIHELFKNDKYFSKLLCYSDNPPQIVLKFYRYGSLFDFIFNRDASAVLVPYSLNVSVHLAERMTNAFQTMHSKGYIHNDIKPANILLDGDDDEPLFPVITDFGITHILDTAVVALGFRKTNIRAGTPEYCAPEVLRSFKTKELISNVKSDVYSFGIVLIELFTRKRAWKQHKVEAVLQGGFPDISVKKMLDNYENITSTIAVEMLRLVLLCIEFEAEKRPSTTVIHEKLYKLESIVKMKGGE
jgi:serine/threonine protein kinase